MEIYRFIIAFIVFLAGWLLYRYPPKKMNYFYGYRTPRSRKSQVHWDFAQRFSGLKIMQSSMFLIVVAIIQFMMPAEEKTTLDIFLIFVILSMVYPLYTTEKALKAMDREIEDPKDE